MENIKIYETKPWQILVQLEATLIRLGLTPHWPDDWDIDVMKKYVEKYGEQRD